MAGLIAKKAVELGMKIPWWVKASFAPGSKVVKDYMEYAGLQTFLDKLGFNIVGYGCTTCIGNSGPLSKKVSDIIEQKNLNVWSVLSGNRNFEGRINPLVKSNFLASPPLVLIYALCGRIDIDLENEEIDTIKNKKVFFKDLWPSTEEVLKLRDKVIKVDFFRRNYKHIFKGDLRWEKIQIKNSPTLNLSINYTYIKKPPFLDNTFDNKDNILKASLF